MNVIYPPTPIDQVRDHPSVFLAGSIEMGTAIDWQQKVIDYSPIKNLPITIYNPRRKDWDSSWPQDLSFAPFREQVEWELNSLEKSSIAFFYFAPGTKSPISLMELGLMLGKWHPTVVCCPKEFWRWANVKITCNHCHVLSCEDFDDALSKLEMELYELL